MSWTCWYFIAYHGGTQKRQGRKGQARSIQELDLGDSNGSVGETVIFQDSIGICAGVLYCREVSRGWGGNEFLGICGTPHVGIRKYFYSSNKGLSRKDGIHMPAPLSASSGAVL